jgi:CheY-like chemotaxis protein
MNGFQLFTTAPSRAFVAIAVTAFGDTAERDRALQAGFKAYLVKPIDPLALVKEIAQHAQRSE